jgi:hypothetical protein
MSLTQVNSCFTSFDLSEEEIKQATNYNALQRAYLQTLLSEAAHTKLNLKFDPTNPVAFAQNDAYLQGKIELLQSLIFNS